MKFKIEKLGQKTLKRLEEHEILLSRNAPLLNREKALVLIGEAMLNKIVKEINEFVSLWKELFPGCHIKDFEASKKKQKILSSHDSAEDRNSMPTDESGIEYWDLPVQKRTNAHTSYKMVSALWGNNNVVYKPVKKQTSNYTQQNRQQPLPRHEKSYQLKQLESFRPVSLRLPKFYLQSSKLSGKTDYSGRKGKFPHFFRVPEAVNYSAFGHSHPLYKSLESYLNNYKGVEAE